MREHGRECYKDCVLTRSHGEDFSQVDTTNGVMMTLGQLVATKAAKMGGRWCSIDSMSECTSSS